MADGGDDGAVVSPSAIPTPDKPEHVCCFILVYCLTQMVICEITEDIRRTDIPVCPMLPICRTDKNVCPPDNEFINHLNYETLH